MAGRERKDRARRVPLAIATLLLLTAAVLACSSFSTEEGPPPPVADGGPLADAPSTPDAAANTCERQTFGFETSLVGDGWDEVRISGGGSLALVTASGAANGHAALAKTIATDEPDTSYLYLRIPQRERIEKLTVSATLNLTAGAGQESPVLGVLIQDDDVLLGGVRLRRKTTDSAFFEYFVQDGETRALGTGRIGSFVYNQPSAMVLRLEGAWTTGTAGPRATFTANGQAVGSELLPAVVSTADAGRHDLYLLVGSIYDPGQDTSVEIDDVVVETCRRP